ncbi:MAG: hypothetical protein HY059_10765 [Proteobacteria bacterium]|nr:hypothetical protein [Pseudomonadota bacterium]
MRFLPVALLALIPSLAAADETADFIASFGPPGLPAGVAEFVRAHPALADIPAPAFAAIRYDRIGGSENALSVVGHEGGITRVRLSLAAAASEAERTFAVGLGGLLFLARTDDARLPGLSDRSTWIKRIDAVEGRLFPLAPGNKLTVDYVLQEGWYFPGARINAAQRFGRWNVRETFEVIGTAHECPETGAAAKCEGFTVAQSCTADGRMVQDGRPIAPPPLWFCQARTERRYSQALSWSWHPAVGSPRTLDQIER